MDLEGKLDFEWVIFVFLMGHQLDLPSKSEGAA